MSSHIWSRSAVCMKTFFNISLLIEITFPRHSIHQSVQCLIELFAVLKAVDFPFFTKVDRGGFHHRVHIGMAWNASTQRKHLTN